MNANMIRTQIFDEMKYNLKGHWRSHTVNFFYWCEMDGCLTEYLYFQNIFFLYLSLSLFISLSCSRSLSLSFSFSIYLSNSSSFLTFKIILYCKWKQINFQLGKNFGKYCNLSSSVLLSAKILLLPPKCEIIFVTL